MIGGGLDLADLAGFDPDAYLESDDPNRSMGCHVGLFSGLNIDRAQTGYIYAWANDTPQGIRVAQINRYQVVQAGDPEMAAYENDPENTTSSGAVDSSKSGYPGLVMVRRSANDERVIRAEEARQREALLRGGDTDRNYESGGSIYQTDQHRMHATEGPSAEGRVLESWAPNRGISS
jgi:hypothetical protein